MSTTYRAVRAAAALLLAGCASAPRHADHLAAASPRDPAALEAAVESFYRAKDVAGLREAVRRAAAAGPGSAAYHEIAAELAFLEDRGHDQVDHLIRALLDRENPAALLHLERLLDTALPDEATGDRVEALLGQLRTVHPDPRVRAFAAFDAAQEAWVRGELERGREALAGVPGVLSFHVIGGWENDQGKGLTTGYPPEERIDLEARYPGALVDVRWRPAVTHPWGTIDLADQIAPDEWSVAYAASGFAVPSGGDYELRFFTSDPVRVFVDGAERFEINEVKSRRFDQFVVPLRLDAGDHRVLIKTAHRSGGWVLFARLTGRGGDAVEGLVRRPPDTGPAAPGRMDTIRGARAMVEALVAPLPERSARRAFHLLAWTGSLVGGAEAIHRGEELLELAPDSLAAGWHTCGVLWDGGELGRAGDVLAGIDARAGEELVLLRVKRARMWRQQGLHRRSREALEKVIGRWPDRRSAYIEMVDLFQAEGWLEDRCAVLEEVMRRWPEWRWGRLERASCLEALGRQPEAEAIYDGMLDVRPADPWTVNAMVSRVTEDGRLGEAARRLREHLEARPDSVWALNRLAELERRMGRNADAERTFLRALAIDPDNAWIWSRLASLAYQEGDRKLAIERWQAALARSPADQQLSNRLAYLVPPAEGDPAADVPEEPALDAAVKAAREARALPGADEIVALDDEVKVLHADGSSMSVITSVRRAITQAGLDAVRDQRLGGGRTRVLAAYAVDAQGRRTEPSTLRDGQVIFRGLQVGSTVVLQYRVDTYPRQVLGRSFEGWWWFESFRRQIIAARFVLWRPAEMPFREKTRGEVGLQRDERRVGELVRVTWTARDTPPVIAEESMPGAPETLTHVRYTTVPDWETFTRWEATLLDEALRPSDDVDRMARTLDPEAPVATRLERIHAYVMQEIRYQQDYENPLARWMPHPTSMVLERRYGDCKDKANLFLMLARATGIDARFALIRTREQGAVDPDLPGLQFNHAIVYVPAQPGLPQARFFDPTADELDLDALPAMDQGTLSLVYDAATRTNEWVPVPFQAPAAGERRAHARLVLSEDGSARAHLAYSVNGGEGSTLRRTARNEEQMRQLVAAIAGWLYSGAEVRESRVSGLDDLRARAGVEMDVGIPGAARLEAGELRLPVPGNLAVVPVPSLPQRRFPMVWNVPSATVWSVDVEAPPGWTVRSLPPPVDASSACIDLSRRSTRSGRTAVHVEVRLTFRCERIGAADYASTRRFLDEARRTLQDPVILARAPR